jgi:hypothetical protein
MQIYFNEQKYGTNFLTGIKDYTRINYTDYLIETIKYPNSEILILQAKLSDKNLIDWKYKLLKDYLKELLKYNYDCCLQFQEYFKNKYFNLKQHDLIEFNSKIKSLKDKEIDGIFSNFSDLYPEKLILIALKDKDENSLLNNMMHTHFINVNADENYIILKKFNTIECEFDLTNWAK